MDISRSNPNVLYLQMEVAQDKEPAGAAAPAAPAADQAAGRAGGGGAGGFGGGGGGGGRGQNGPPNPQKDGIWKSIDHGKTWTFMNNENQRPMYFSQIRVDPNDPNTIYVGGVNCFKSVDGGKTMLPIEQAKGHVDNHAIWIDPLNSKHIMYGDDGGMDVSWDAGATFESPRLTGTGLAYHASVDLEHPYNVCVGLQDNGSWCGPSSVRSTQGDPDVGLDERRGWRRLPERDQPGRPEHLLHRVAEPQHLALQHRDGRNPQREAECALPQPEGWRRGRRGRLWRRTREHHSRAAGRHALGVQLELPDPALALRPEHRVPSAARSSSSHATAATRGG